MMSLKYAALTPILNIHLVIISLHIQGLRQQLQIKQTILALRNFYLFGFQVIVRFLICWFSFQIIYPVP